MDNVKVVMQFPSIDSSSQSKSKDASSSHVQVVPQSEVLGPVGAGQV